MTGPLPERAARWPARRRRAPPRRPCRRPASPGISNDSPRWDEVGGRRRALYRRAHRILVVLDDEHDGQLPQLRHVEGLVHLALVGGAVAEVGEAHAVVAAILVGEGETRRRAARRRRRCRGRRRSRLGREHVHRPALALRAAVAAPGQLGHDGLGVHADGERVAVVAISGDHLVARLKRHLHADDDRFLADVEMAEAADMAHAVELAGLFLEAADEQHAPIGLELLVARKSGAGRLLVPVARRALAAGRRSGRRAAREDFPEAIEIPRRRYTGLVRRSRSLQEQIGDGQNGAVDVAGCAQGPRSGARQHLIVRAHEAQHFAGDLLDEIGVRLLGRRAVRRRARAWRARLRGF